MVNLRIVCVGKLKEKFYTEAVTEYSKRLGGYCKLTLIELPEVKLPRNPSSRQMKAALEREGAMILERLPRDGKTVALCVEGELHSSEGLADTLRRWTVGGVSQICFVIGSSFGLAPAVKERAGLLLSISPMTFPHHLVRVILLEQLYRAFQINTGGAYHK